MWASKFILLRIHCTSWKCRLMWVFFFQNLLWNLRSFQPLIPQIFCLSPGTPLGCMSGVHRLCSLFFTLLSAPLTAIFRLSYFQLFFHLFKLLHWISHVSYFQFQSFYLVPFYSFYLYWYSHFVHRSFSCFLSVLCPQSLLALNIHDSWFKVWARFLFNFFPVYEPYCLLFLCVSYHFSL